MRRRSPRSQLLSSEDFPSRVLATCLYVARCSSASTNIRTTYAGRYSALDGGNSSEPSNTVTQRTPSSHDDTGSPPPRTDMDLRPPSARDPRRPASLRLLRSARLAGWTPGCHGARSGWPSLGTCAVPLLELPARHHSNSSAKVRRRRVVADVLECRCSPIWEWAAGRWWRDCARRGAHRAIRARVSWAADHRHWTCTFDPGHACLAQAPLRRTRRVSTARTTGPRIVTVARGGT
ncbi:uncharacterized protein C8Q71DRAFT_192440 [Rhodofomes roseus]|uniref:Uncharacterized protein n=1 Tax=Rhodofomes roseus TaxID=34475 RepID=A0ABQ8K8J5_9APHY|nr:uncharacterized protein C8Q71DRAFT_192440 [Rhodofomes roseus]KAH9833160.1 hypothetical protein C8Q71DRAFT_192440 [Rhodofomes roseus]